MDRRQVLVVVASMAMGTLLGYGIAVGTQADYGPARGGRLVGARGPQGELGGDGLPALPAGLSVDSTGLIQGLDLKVAPGTQGLAWETLRTYAYTQAVGLTEVPEAIRAADGKRVTMIGFLMPLYEFDDIHQFVLVGNHWSCCYGVPAGLNGVVNVSLSADAEGLRNTLEPLQIVGTFRVKEVREEGWLISIFSIEDATAKRLE